MRSVTVQLFDLDKDIASDLTTTQARNHISADTSHVLFDPQSYNFAAMNYQLSRYQLDQNTLHSYAEMATKIRQRFECDED